MDFFDLIAIVPSGLPGERSPDLAPEQRFAAGAASALFPAISFALVLLTGFASDATIALAVLPLGAAALTYVLVRLFTTPIAWAVLFAFGCAALCLRGDTCALLLDFLVRFFQDF